MDRNIQIQNTPKTRKKVALRKESVDRNWYFTDKGCKCSVALRKESVDRNMSEANLSAFVQKSLSARRAWIEIMGYY